MWAHLWYDDGMASNVMEDEIPHMVTEEEYVKLTGTGYVWGTEFSTHHTTPAFWHICLI